LLIFWIFFFETLKTKKSGKKIKGKKKLEPKLILFFKSVQLILVALKVRLFKEGGPFGLGIFLNFVNISV
jgi:hypothetical protein